MSRKLNWQVITKEQNSVKLLILAATQINLYQMYNYCNKCNTRQAGLGTGALALSCPAHSSQEFMDQLQEDSVYYDTGERFLYRMTLNQILEEAISNPKLSLRKAEAEQDQNFEIMGDSSTLPVSQKNPNAFSNAAQEVSERSNQLVGCSLDQSDQKEQDEPTIYRKNQYDKNIPGNIVSTVLSQMIDSKYHRQISFYCSQLKTSVNAVLDFAKKNQSGRKKIGTSWIGECFSEKNASNNVYKVFGLFMTRFLREQYYLHILSIGKMREKQKYLECATKLMFVPRLQKHEYKLISRFQ